MVDLVTGASGFLGNVLVRELLERNHEVCVFLRKTSDITPIKDLPVTRLYGDVLDKGSLINAFGKVDVVYHLAGKISIMPGDRSSLTKVNYTSIVNVIEACLEKKIKKLIYTSTIHALKEPGFETTIDESVPYCINNPRGCYDSAKAHASLEVLKAVKEGLDAVILNPTGVIGPYDFPISPLTQTFIDYAKGKLKLMVEGAFDFVDVRDVALGHIYAYEKGRTGESYILSGHRVKISELMKMLESITNIKAPNHYLPIKAAKAIGSIMPLYYWLTRKKPCFTRYSVETLVSNSYISHDKATKELGYHPRPISQCIKDTIDWLKEIKLI
ncbi:MAG: SDR family oxidoreductase [Actinomycetota bacterium]|nr:SDR family oxidoreductase [Actinomycetota bacterium]